MTIALDVIHKGTPSSIGTERAYEKSMYRRRDEMLARVREGYEEFLTPGEKAATHGFFTDSRSNALLC